MRQLRWAFNISHWKPTQCEWEIALSSIPEVEVHRIIQYKHQCDVKASLIGQLLLRRAGSMLLQLPWREVSLGRTERGKPYLVNETTNSAPISLNISHHGDYTVLAANDECQLGIDVMKTKWPPNKDGREIASFSKQDGDQYVNRFFHLMRRKFTNNEWETIQAGYDAKEKLFRFHRHWCLKESFIKAIGLGIHFDLKRLDFNTRSNVNVNCVTKDTQLVLDGKLQTNWLFEEIMLDAKHCVSTALCSDESGIDMNNLLFCEFEFPLFPEIINSAQPLGHAISKSSHKQFISLKERPGRY